MKANVLSKTVYDVVIWLATVTVAIPQWPKWWQGVVRMTQVAIFEGQYLKDF